MAKIGIVTVLYNSASVLEDYFKTLSEQTFKDFVLYVIDNKSPDESLALSYKYAEQYKGCYKTVIIENPDNLGVAAGNNIGVKKALSEGCDYILLSNNDIVLAHDCIELLLMKLQKENLDMIVPKIFFYGESLIWSAGGKFSWISGATKQFGSMLPDAAPFNEYKLITYAPTCFMLIDSNVFKNIGMFDEKYFVYFDDTDWIYRCYLSKKKMGYYPDSVMWHKESTCTGGMKSNFYVYYITRNKYYFCRKHYSKLHLAFIIIANYIYYQLFRKKQYTPEQRVLAKKAFSEGMKM